MPENSEKNSARRAKRRSLAVEVVWADIRMASGDVHVVGHYIGVMPQNAELVLDRALSGTDEEDRLVLTDLTRRGAIRGALGEVNFFPWGSVRRPDNHLEVRTVAVAGMGRPGTFAGAQLRVLARSVAQTAGRLNLSTIATVLIGSGDGNMEIPDAVSGLVNGVVEALEADPRLRLEKLRIVEFSLDRALEIRQFMVETFGKPARDASVILDIAPRLVEEKGGDIPTRFKYSLLLAAIANTAGLPPTSKTRAALEAVVAELPPGEFPSGVFETLQKECDKTLDLRQLALKLRLAPAGHKETPEPPPTRMTFSLDGKTIRGAAVTNTTTVTIRAVGVRPGLIDRSVERLHDPLPSEAEARAASLLRLLVPPDLREVLQDDVNPLVMEVDRNMARVQWEMLPGRDGVPIGVQRQVARQLRTTYSPRVTDLPLQSGLQALVIGDPGDPERGQSLGYARTEALEVRKLLEERGVAVVLRIGAPNDLGKGPIEGEDPADFLDVLELLLSGRFGLVHYTGHGQFDPESPELSGWVFKDDVLTASDLQGLVQPPMLIVANACLSAGLSPGATGARREDDQEAAQGDPRLVASLADEFFKRGVADYIGTAWEVQEKPATAFAKELYETLLPAKRSSSSIRLGEAVRKAREVLYKKRKEWGPVWGAYQHYGDPSSVPVMK